MPDKITAESAKSIETADNSIKKATTNEAVNEALNGLAISTDTTQRAQEVTQATNILVHNGDLPQLLLVFEGSDNLGKLGMGDDKIDKNNSQEMTALESAAETGQFTDKDGKVVTLTQAEWVAAQALFSNFDAVERSAAEGGGDGVVSTGDINHAATDATAQQNLGTRYAEMESIVMAFPGLADGSVDPAAFSKVFGKDAVSKTDVETLLRSPDFDNLTEQQQRGVLALYSQFDSIAGRNGDPSLVTPDEVWGAAGDIHINYGGNKDAMAEAQADVDAYENWSQPQASVSGDTVDSIIRDLEKPMPSGVTTFDYLDSVDQNADGSITKEQVHALATSPTLSLMDPKLASSIQALDQNWDQLSGGKDSMTITDLAAQSTSYKDDTTPEAIKARAAEAAKPLTTDQINDAMRAIFQPNPGTDTSAFYTLTEGQEGRPEDRKGFTVEDIDRTLAAYSSLYGADSPEYQAAQTSLGQIRQDFDKYDTDGDGAISYNEMKTLSGDGHNVGELQKIYTPADSETMAGLLAAGGDYSHQNGQENLTQDELKHYINDLPEDSPERATLQYVLDHYDQIKAADDDDKNLTWNDIETFAGVDGTDNAGNSNGLKPGDKVPLGTGAGIVNSDGTVSYTIGEWTEADQRETPNNLASTVLEMWGFEGPYSDEMITQTLAVISAANPDVDIYNFPTGVEIIIPGEPPSSENE